MQIKKRIYIQTVWRHLRVDEKWQTLPREMESVTLYIVGHRSSRECFICYKTIRLLSCIARGRASSWFVHGWPRSSIQWMWIYPIWIKAIFNPVDFISTGYNSGWDVEESLTYVLAVRRAQFSTLLCESKTLSISGHSLIKC